VAVSPDFLTQQHTVDSILLDFTLCDRSNSLRASHNLSASGSSPVWPNMSRIALISISFIV
jgi:hypothetical protein